MEEGDLAADKSTAAALGGWIVFEDECGQSMRPPRSRTWGRRGITPVIRVRGGGTGHVSVAGLACYRPGHRTRLIYRLHCYRGRKGETRAFTWAEYRNLLIAAHRQLPGGNVVLVWDNLSVHLRAELWDFTGAQAWLRVFRLPAYAPDLNPVDPARRPSDSILSRRNDGSGAPQQPRALRALGRYSEALNAAQRAPDGLAIEPC
ncbi:MAG TPA: transposase [Streptosporangiaceae bacterium]|nr:transposase [Streptosporangiaceae bacterium]